MTKITAGVTALVSLLWMRRVSCGVTTLAAGFTTQAPAAQPARLSVTGDGTISTVRRLPTDRIYCVDNKTGAQVFALLLFGN